MRRLSLVHFRIFGEIIAHFSQVYLERDVPSFKLADRQIRNQMQRMHFEVMESADVSLVDLNPNFLDQYFPDSLNYFQMLQFLYY